MVVIIDYGAGNLFSLSSSLTALGIENTISNKPRDLQNAERIILPGVGAFGDAMKKLADTGLVPVLDAEVQAGKPLLGICLGMQLLFQKSCEYGEHKGLGYIEGEITSLSEEFSRLGKTAKVPHMGWNSLEIAKPQSPLMKYTRYGEYVYYVHSFYKEASGKSLVAASDYGVMVAGAVEKDNVFGTQFHPEKSGETGLKILKAFSEI